MVARGSGRIARSLAVIGAVLAAMAFTAAGANALAGIPERNLILGSQQARFRLVEMADLQCPYCAYFTKHVLPAVLQKYVRSNTLQIWWSGVGYLGPDSTRADRFALAAGFQGRLWGFVEAFYQHQRTENSGYVTDAFLRQIARLSGVRVAKALRDRKSSAVSRELRTADNLFNAAGDPGTPTFLLSDRQTGALTWVQNALSPAVFEQELDAAIASG